MKSLSSFPIKLNENRLDYITSLVHLMRKTKSYYDALSYTLVHTLVTYLDPATNLQGHPQPMPLSYNCAILTIR